uniref:Predicted gene 12689 n=1 Tax=Jaculus jaculus TaxID=51337 RepID=A0A8C5P0I7_JACJA
CVASLFTTGNVPGTPSPCAAEFSIAAGPEFSVKRGALPVGRFAPALGLYPTVLGVVGLWSQDRVEDRGEISYAQTITMGSKPQNIYLFQLNDSIKWTPAMFPA